MNQMMCRLSRQARFLAVVIAIQALLAPVTNGLTGFAQGFENRPSLFPDSRQGFAEWQASYRSNLAAWIMGGGVPDRVPLNAQVTNICDYAAFTLHSVTYNSLADRTNTLLISLPKGVARAPVLLALHGHENTWGAANPAAYTPGNVDDFCAYFAERGWAVVQPATMDHTLQHPSWTLIGEWTWDSIRALDYAATLPQVDMDRVGVAGLSTGGLIAMSVSALDDRVKAGVVAGILTTWRHVKDDILVPPNCDCGMIAQLSSRLEFCDWAALAASKPVEFQHGLLDAQFCPGADPALLNPASCVAVMPQDEYNTMFSEVERAYALAGSPAGASTLIHNGGHEVDNEAAYQWITTNTAPEPGTLLMLLPVGLAGLAGLLYYAWKKWK